MNKRNIILEDGGNAVASCPVIVSASRSTDIPAFYADWFFHRLQVGYSVWTNPFSKVRSYVSYKDTRFIVFWSKNPHPLLPYLDILRGKGIGCYIQYTLNDYELERLETGVPPLVERIDTFKKLATRLGKEAVIWRFDPMLLTGNLSLDGLLDKVERIGDQLKGYTEKMVFSYADIANYRKVKSNLDKSGICYREWTEGQMVEFAERLSELNKTNGWNYALATCGEKVELARYGIAHNRCIDADLIARLAWQDKTLMKHMGVEVKEITSHGLFDDGLLPPGAIPLPGNRYFISQHKKDPGQRLLCGCMASKDIGEYDTCPHLCEYCYANSSKPSALANWERHQNNNFSETITGK